MKIGIPAIGWFSKYPPEARPLEEVLQVIGELPDGDVTLRSPYLEIKILMTEPEPSYKYKIEEALKGKAVRLARIAAMLPQKRQVALPPLPMRNCRPSVRWIWHWMSLNEIWRDGDVRYHETIVGKCDQGGRNMK